MIDHIGVRVSDVERSKTFYEKAFEPLDYIVSFGKEGMFWAFKTGDALFEIQQIEKEYSLMPVHVAFRAKSKEEVDAFHRAALAAGGKDNGAPGPRPEYTENYYACFVLDPDGHNIEVMTEAG